MQKAKLLTGAIFAAALGSSAFAQDTIPTYSITNNLSQPIYDISMFWRAPEQGYGTGMLFSGDSPGYEVAGNSTQTLSDLDKPVPPTGELLLGLYTDPASAGQPAQDHVVLFMNNTAASSAKGIDWGTVFPNTDEDQLISDIKTINTPNADWNSSLNNIFNFVNGDADHIPSGSSPTGSITSWLTPAANNVPATGSIMMWSSGTQIGSFTATNVVATPAPESYAVFAVGLLGFSFARRKKIAS